MLVIRELVGYGYDSTCLMFRVRVFSLQMPDMHQTLVVPFALQLEIARFCFAAPLRERNKIALR